MRHLALLVAHLALARSALQAPIPIAPGLRAGTLQKPALVPPRLRAASPRLGVSDDAYCIVSDELPQFAREDKIFDALLLASPVIIPFVSFFSYPMIQKLYHEALDMISGRTWYLVDGGASRVFDLLPVTNGIVVPSVSVAFGTLTAITIQTLRTRQITICAALNKEACALRNLHSATSAVFAGPAYDRERLQINTLLGEYCTRLIFESRLGVDLDALLTTGASDSEIDGVVEILYGAPAKPQAEERLFLQNTDFTAMNLARDLQMVRSERLAQLQAPFPAVHWLILTILASTLVIAYLFETDLQVLQFLDDLQLRYLFTVLTSAFLALASLCNDLADPFRGGFTIAPTTSQLETIRQYIRGDCESDEALQRLGAS